MTESNQFTILIDNLNTTFKVTTLGKDKDIIELVIALADWDKKRNMTCSKYKLTTEGWSTIFRDSKESVDCSQNIISLLESAHLLNLRINIEFEPWLDDTPTLYHILSKAERTSIKLTSFLIRSILSDDLVTQFQAVLGLLRKFLFANKEKFKEKYEYSVWTERISGTRYSLSDLILRKNKNGKNAIDMAEDGEFKQFLIYITDNIPLGKDFIPAVKPEDNNTTLPAGGKARKNTKVKTDKRVKVNGRMRVVYRGARGAEYIKNKDVYIRV